MSEVYSPDCYMARRLRGRYPERYGQERTMKQDETIDIMKEARDGRFGELKLNVTLKNRRQFYFRVWLMGKLCWLAMWVAPVPATMTTDEEDD